METVHLADFSSLERACYELHDCLFDLDKVNFDSTQAIWEGRFIRPMDDPGRSETRRKYLLWSVRYFPLVQTVLRIRKIKLHRVNDRAGIGMFTFSDVCRTPTGCTLRFHEDMEIELDFDGDAVGELVDECVLDRRGYVKSFFLIESGISIE